MLISDTDLEPSGNLTFGKILLKVLNVFNFVLTKNVKSLLLTLLFVITEVNGLIGFCIYQDKKYLNEKCLNIYLIP